MKAVCDLAVELHREAQARNERRLLVLAGPRATGYRLLPAILEAVSIPVAETVHVGRKGTVLACPHVAQAEVEDLLGTTASAVIYDAHDALVPNTLGILSGIVDGGGLFVLLSPSLDAWPDRRDDFDERLAVPPYDVTDVGDRFKRRIVRTLREHPGVGIVALAEEGIDTVERRGLTKEAVPAGPQRARRPRSTVPSTHAFPDAAYEACLTADQRTAVATLEHLRNSGSAVVIEADRGRGKSSAAGIAAACLAAEGADVLVTAPTDRAVEALFERAVALGDDLGGIDTRDVDGRTAGRHLTVDGRGSIRFVAAASLEPATEGADVLLVDEAAAIPVRELAAFLAVDRVAFVTTIHGYEGAGQGFSVRFRDRLAASDHEVVEYTMREPIRYAPGDPVEIWAFHTLLLDARPVHGDVVEDATPGTVTPAFPSQDALAADEGRLRETFGLLVLAHYHTEPNDLARLLDAPNLSTTILTHDDRVVSVGLLAEEGGLAADRRRALYEGGRIRGHMLPDLLTSQLRDLEAGRPTGRRVVRLATHQRVRSRGLGSALVETVVEDLPARVDWVGAGFGAVPALVRFWAAAGFRCVHLATTRNERSGEHSVIMLRPTAPAGEGLFERHTDWFLERVDGMLADPLSGVDPDVIRAVLAATDGSIAPTCSDRAWRLVAAAAFGPGLFDVAPHPFRRIALAALLDGSADVLPPREQRLLVTKVLQGRPWPTVVERHGYPSRRMCMRALGRAYRPLIDTYGPPAARDERDRYREDG